MVLSFTPNLVPKDHHQGQYTSSIMFILDRAIYRKEARWPVFVKPLSMSRSVVERCR